ncbi:hypothetical protein SDC9_174516 [bioreactor metagenome]|uniref:Uncharacterized protein n=1 Tax=bioreactor metagenome TaxID=1076179 RepID=A0A645GMI1_9ZZZZ
MHDHMCCIALFTTAVVAITGVVYYKAQLAAARNRRKLN